MCGCVGGRLLVHHAIGFELPLQELHLAPLHAGTRSGQPPTIFWTWASYFVLPRGRLHLGNAYLLTQLAPACGLLCEGCGMVW